MRKLLLPTIIIALMITGTIIISADEEEPEEPFAVTGTVIEVDSNDIILELDDGSTIIIDTWPKWFYFVDEDENGDNDDLEALVGQQVTVVGEPKYEEVTDELGNVTEVLVGVDAYDILDAAGNILIHVRDAGKPPWKGGPKS